MENTYQSVLNDNQLICAVHAQGVDLGYLVMDSLIQGRAHGGLRIGLDVDERLMSMLARTMTLKYGFAGLPLGGAKAGVIGDPEAPLEERRSRLVAFAHGIRTLIMNRIYVPASDMATDNADIRYMLQETGVPIKARQWNFDLSGYFTGTSVAAAAKAACDHKGLAISQCTVAIEGYGKVGRSVANHLKKSGAKIVAVSTLHGAIYNTRGLDLSKIDNLITQYGSHFVDVYQEADHLLAGDLLELNVDILSPCATHHSIDIKNAPRLQPIIIVPGANNPITPEAESYLVQQGVLSIPDFVANCGGAMGTLMQVAHLKVDKIDEAMDDWLHQKISRLLIEAEAYAGGLRKLSEDKAIQTMRRNQNRSRSPNIKSRVFQVGLEFNRRGLLPGGLVSRLAEPYFRRLILGRLP